MRTACITPLATLVTCALLAACESESDPVALKLQAMSFTNSAWSEPVNLGAPVNSTSNDQSPTLSKDGLALYFNSDRPGGLSGFDIMVSRRACADLSCPWETPRNLGPLINTSANEGGAALSPDGHLLFFQSSRPGGAGETDIYVSRRANPQDDFGWGPPVNLGPHVNTAGFDVAPSYLQSAEDGSANLYFHSGADNNLLADIYSVAVTRDGEPLGPAVLVQELSFPGRPDGFPSVRADGREIFFNSGRPVGGVNVNDLWVSTRRSVHDPWSPPENLGTPVNSPFAEFQPDLSHDGRTLHFIAGGPRGGSGGFDVWMSTRTVNGKEEP
jgi:Tol biopolymer transport system component